MIFMQRIMVLFSILPMLFILPAMATHCDMLLLKAVQENNIPKMNQLLKEGARVDAKDEENKTALMVAAQLGYAAMVAELIANGANVFALDNNNWDAFDYATHFNQEVVAAQLLKNGAGKDWLQSCQELDWQLEDELASKQVTDQKKD